MSCFCAVGDVEIGLMERNGQLEVEIVQARGLIMKPGSKGPPGNYQTELNFLITMSVLKKQFGKKSNSPHLMSLFNKDILGVFSLKQKLQS